VLLVAITSCGKDPEQIAARTQLDELGVPYSDEEFLKRLSQSDPVAVDLFLAAGMNPNLDWGKALRIAAGANNTNIMKILFDRGAKANAKPWFSGTTALCSAVDEGDLEAFQMLFEQGARIKGSGCEHAILLRPTDRRHIELIRLLLDHGADPNLENWEYDSALMKAISDADIVHLLLERGADPNFGSYNYMPIHGASGNPEILEDLLNHGADPDGKDPDGRAAIMYYSPDESLLLLLDHGANINAKSDNGTTALMMAAEFGRAKRVQLLLENGADVDAQNNYGGTALMNAKEWGHTEVVKLLENAENIRKEASMTKALRRSMTSKKEQRATAGVSNKSSGRKEQKPGKKPYDFDTFLEARKQLASMGIEFDMKTFLDFAKRGNAEIVRLFLDTGMDPDAANHEGETALMSAVENNNIEIARLLLQSGADVDAWEPSFYTTALMRAASKGNAEMVELLLEANPDVNAFESAGFRALTNAVARNHTEIVRKLLDAGAQVDHLALYYSLDKNEILNMLLDAGVEMNQRIYGRTPLLKTAMDENAEAVEMLVKHGADVNIRDDEGKTDLMIASWGDSAEPVKLLLDAGCDIEAQDPFGQTALMQAAWYGNGTVVKTLLEAGADADARDQYGLTALSRARFRGHSEIRNLLEKAMVGLSPEETEEERTLLSFLLVGEVKVLATLDISLDKGLDGAEVRIRLEGRKKAIDFKGIPIPVAIRISGIFMYSSHHVRKEGVIFRKSCTINNSTDVIHLSGEEMGINRSTLKAYEIQANLGAIIHLPYHKPELVCSKADLELDWS
jgi:ankyrin repeat protein